MSTQRKTVELKENPSYGQVKFHSQTATEETVYEDPDGVQPSDVHIGQNVAYAHVSS